MLFTRLRNEKAQENKPISTADSVFIAANTANEILSAVKNRVFAKETCFCHSKLKKIKNFQIFSIFFLTFLHY
jgi:hypothetical protein